MLSFFIQCVSIRFEHLHIIDESVDLSLEFILFLLSIDFPLSSLIQHSDTAVHKVFYFRHELLNPAAKWFILTK